MSHFTSKDRCRPLIEALEPRELLSSVVGPILHIKADPIATLVAGQPVLRWPGELDGITNRSEIITATLRWGDGSTNTISVWADAFGKVEPAWTHTYDRAGLFTAGVAFRLGKKLLGSVAETVRVRENSPGGVTRNASTGRQFVLTLGTLRQPITPDVIGIQWGDGTHSLGVSTALGNNRYRITGSHTYATPGTYHLIITGSASPRPLFPLPGEPEIETADRVGDRVSFYSTIEVHGRAVTLPTPAVQITALPSLAAPGGMFSGPVAQFTGLAQNPDGPEVYAIIDWGDGSKNISTPVPTQSGQYSLSGFHGFYSYPADGVFITSLTGGGFTTGLSGTFTVTMTVYLNDHDDPAQNTVLGMAQTTITSTPN